VPREILDPVAGQFSALIVSNPEDSVFFWPFEQSNLESLGITNISEWQAVGRTLVSELVLPAFSNLLRFWTEVYLPNARQTIGITALPDGVNFYQHLIKQETTTNRTAQEVFDLGNSEVDRIKSEMMTIISQLNFTGTFTEFVDSLKADPRFYLSTEEDFLKYIRDIAKRADPLMASLFVKLPRCPYGVVPVPADYAPAAPSAYYYDPSADCRRPGYYYVNTYDLPSRPTYLYVSTTLHETVPGHHLQLALQQELPLPDFRKYGGGTGYIEGWALYSEHLGEEMGFYVDPYIHFGALGDEMLRACRLVVDSGMHAFGWTREQSVQFMLDNTPLSELDIRAEVDRYVAWPGQALAYKSGELVFKQLRDDATAALGEKFDLREFHQALLNNGALPLSLVSEQIDKYILEKQQE